MLSTRLAELTANPTESSPGISQQALTKFVELAAWPFPDDYLEFLQSADGATLRLPGTEFELELHATSEILALTNDYGFEAHNLLIVGTDGMGSALCLRKRAGKSAFVLADYSGGKILATLGNTFEECLENILQTVLKETKKPAPKTAKKPPSPTPASATPPQPPTPAAPALQTTLPPAPGELRHLNPPPGLPAYAGFAIGFAPGHDSILALPTKDQAPVLINMHTGALIATLALPNGILVNSYAHLVATDSRAAIPAIESPSGKPAGTLLYELPSGKLLAHLPEHTPPVSFGASLSPDGRFAFTTADAFYFWDTATGKLHHKIPGGGPCSFDRLYPADGMPLLIEHRIFDGATGRLMRCGEQAFAGSPDGRFYVSSCYVTGRTANPYDLWLREIRTGKCLWRAELPDRPGNAHFLPGGTAILIKYEGAGLQVFDAASGQTISAKIDTVNSYSFLPRANGKSVILIDESNVPREFLLPALQRPGSAPVPSPQAALDTTAFRLPPDLAALYAAGRAPENLPGVTFLSPAQVADAATEYFATHYNLLRIADLPDGRMLAVDLLADPPSFLEVPGFAFTPGKYWGTSLAQVRAAMKSGQPLTPPAPDPEPDLPSNAPVVPFPKASAPGSEVFKFKVATAPQAKEGIRSLAVSPDGRRLALSRELGGTSLFDLHTGKIIAHADSLSRAEVAFRPSDGKPFVIGQARAFADLDTGTMLWPPVESANCITRGAVSPGLTRIVRNLQWELLEVPSGRLLTTLPDLSYSYPGQPVAFSSDGRWLAAVKPGNQPNGSVVSIHNGRTGRLLRQVQAVIGAPASLFLLEHATRLLASWGKVALFDTLTGKELLSRDLWTENSQGMCLLLDGQHVAVGTTAGTIHILRLDTLESVHVLQGVKNAANVLAPHPDGKHLLTAGKNALVHVWRL